jgi:hypothetical protein
VAYQLQPSNDSISAVKTAVVAGRVPWDPHSSRCQTLHASYNHRGLHWFDTVLVQLQNGTQHAQLRLLFSCKVDGAEFKLALVRWLEPTTPNDILAAAGAKVLRYEMHGRGAARQVLHGIVALRSIVRRVYAVPTWGTAFGGAQLPLEQHRFRLCPWKWDREVPDQEGFQPPLGAAPAPAAARQVAAGPAAQAAEPGDRGERAGAQDALDWGGGAGDAAVDEGGGQLGAAEEVSDDESEVRCTEDEQDPTSGSDSGMESNYDSDLESNYDAD